MLKQLTRALPDLYLLPYRDQTTNTISTPLVDILQQLFQTYDSISDEELEEQESNLKTRIFDLTQPLVHLFQAVENLQQLATATNCVYTDRQIVSLGLKLIKNMQEFEKGREKWPDHPTHKQIWINFRIHFITEWFNNYSPTICSFCLPTFLYP